VFGVRFATIGFGATFRNFSHLLYLLQKKKIIIIIK
jgi:hypothetical protein